MAVLVRLNKHFMEEETLDTEVLNSEENLDSNQETEVVGNEELAKVKEIADNQRIRAEKAERELKALKKPVQAEKETPKNESLNLKDIRALQDVPDEDVDEVMDFAKYKGISIAEAKTNPVIKTLLHTRKEERKTAEATSTGVERKRNNANSDSALMDKVDNQSLADEDMEKAADLVFRSYGKK